VLCCAVLCCDRTSPTLLSAKLFLRTLSSPLAPYSPLYRFVRSFIYLHCDAVISRFDGRVQKINFCTLCSPVCACPSGMASHRPTSDPSFSPAHNARMHGRGRDMTWKNMIDCQHLMLDQAENCTENDKHFIQFLNTSLPLTSCHDMLQQPQCSKWLDSESRSHFHLVHDLIKFFQIKEVEIQIHGNCRISASTSRSKCSILATSF
jgi:hypothetical protein